MWDALVGVSLAAGYLAFGFIAWIIFLAVTGRDAPGWALWVLTFNLTTAWAKIRRRRV